MKISAKRLEKESADTGFRPDTLEKVIYLLDLLDQLFSDRLLRDRLVLKGGTAINLFVFDLPRLSVDIDLNYIGAADGKQMLAERPQVEETISAICQRAGYKVNRLPGDFAGGKWRIGYQSALGNQGNLELDLNFMFRLNFRPIVKTDSCKLGSYQALQIPVLDARELLAGKLSALLTRTATRDLFDAEKLMSTIDLNDETFRLIYVLYGAMNPRADWRDIKTNNITGDTKDLREKLIPLLKIGTAPAAKDQDKYVDKLVARCKLLIKPLFPLRDNECEFISLLRDKGTVEPALLTSDSELADKIKTHPAILRRAAGAMLKNEAGGSKQQAET